MFFLVKLQFRGAVCFGSRDLLLGEEFTGIIHSDTLFSAIVNQWVKLPILNNEIDSIENLINRLNSGSPPFRISSAFPYFGEEYYLPTPHGSEEIYMETLKDVPFLVLDDYIELANGNFDRIKQKRHKDPIGDVLFNFINPRVTIDRMTTSTNIYEMTGQFFRKGGGLYFLIDLQDNALKDKIALCINLLGEQGLGGDKSVGFGQFTTSITNIDSSPYWTDLFKKREGGKKYYYSLSLCCPANKEEALSSISYQIVPRKGWILSSSSPKQMKRRECKMVAEGSLFNKPVNGMIENVTPSKFISEHHIYRYGLVMLVELLS